MDGKGKDIEYKVEQKEPAVVRESTGVQYQAVPQPMIPIYVEVADEVNPTKLYTESELAEEVERRTVELREESKKYELESLIYEAEIDWLSDGKTYDVEDIKAEFYKKYENQILNSNDIPCETRLFSEEEFEKELAKRIRALKRQKQMYELEASLFEGKAYVLKGGKTYTIEELEAELDKKYEK